MSAVTLPGNTERHAGVISRQRGHSSTTQAVGAIKRNRDLKDLVK